MFISVIIPTYNRAHLIAGTLDSILAQKYQDFEIIIVDDGSTDDTEMVVASYLSDNVSYYKKENGERGAARNFGASKAKGDLSGTRSRTPFLVMSPRECRLLSAVANNSCIPSSCNSFFSLECRAQGMTS